MSRGTLTQRATVKRNTAVGTDAWNRPAAPVFTPHVTISCRVWSRQKRHVRDDGKDMVVEDIRGIFPADADLKQGDRVEFVKDRSGNVLFEGPLAVQTLTGQGANRRHVSAMLTRHL